LIVTAGGWEEHYSARGVNGPIDDLLFPINHGILYYPGYDVLPPFVVYRVDRLDESGFEPIAESLRERMRTLFTAHSIPYRQQNGGDYLIPSMQLHPKLGNPGTTGFALHLNNEDRAADDSGNEARKEISSAIPESPRAQAAAHFRNVSPE
jgi:NAD(P)H dehydrogenase (quinone)